MTQLYKVTLPYQYDAGRPCTSVVVALALATRASEWLQQQARDQHCINAYNNGERGITFVFNDATTATLFRLSH